MNSPVRRRAVRQLIEDWQSAGLTHLPKPRKKAVETVALPQTTASEAVPMKGSRPKESVVELPVVTAPTHPVVAESGEAPKTREERIAALQAVAERVRGCTRCKELASTRTQTVFGVGNPEARVMFIGEAPGADEDAQGEPFVGRAGQLLNKIIGACGWAREDIYICNILRCRPPGNRTPLPEEAKNCREYLDAQIRIVAPEYIVCWGACAAQNLLGKEDAIGKLRQKFFSHGAAKVLCTYHPSYLLRNPSAKKPVWDDMLLLLDEMGLKPPATGGNAG